MYRILIADSEGGVSDMIHRITRERITGEFVLAEASTGRSAIEQAEYFHPDVVFMDIQMPGISGLQAMQEIRQINRNVFLYVITGYEKIDYAQEAIRIGVERYVTKPVAENVLVEILDDAVRKIDDLRNKRSSFLKAQEKLEAVYPVAENALINSIIFQNSRFDANYYKQLLEITEEYAYVCVFSYRSRTALRAENYSYRTDDPAGRTDPVGEDEDISGEFRDSVSQNMRALIGDCISEHITVVVPCEDEQNSEADMQFINQIIMITERLEKKTDKQIRVGIGKARRFEELRESYLEAEKQLKEKSRQIVFEGENELPNADGHRFIQKAKAYILEHYQEDINLEELARIVQVSPYYFSRLFKEETGENFIEYLTRMRIEHAKEQLADSSVSIRKISVDSGYADPNYFSRLFKKQTGMTPKEYREKTKE